MPSTNRDTSAPRTINAEFKKLVFCVKLFIGFWCSVSEVDYVFSNVRRPEVIVLRTLPRRVREFVFVR